MISSKDDFFEYIKCDKERNIGNLTGLKYYAKKILGTRDGILAYEYLRALRSYEYAINCRKKVSLLGKLYYLYARYNHARLSQKYNINISPNMVGKGLRLPHIIGGGIIINCLSMGDFCTVNANVVVGKKDTDKERPIIGKNVDLCIGSKIIGGITIKDNVVVAPNSVVVKDIEEGCIVAGIPAQIISRK